MSGDEIISDSYNLKDIDDVVYEVDCKMVKVGGESFGQRPSIYSPRLRGGHDEA